MPNKTNEERFNSKSLQQRPLIFIYLAHIFMQLFAFLF